MVFKKREKTTGNYAEKPDNPLLEEHSIRELTDNRIGEYTCRNIEKNHLAQHQPWLVNNIAFCNEGGPLTEKCN